MLACLPVGNLPGGIDGGVRMEREGSDFTVLVHRDLNWIEARLKFENNLQQKLESRHHRRYQLQVEPFLLSVSSGMCRHCACITFIWNKPRKEEIPFFSV